MQKIVVITVALNYFVISIVFTDGVLQRLTLTELFQAINDTCVVIAIDSPSHRSDGNYESTLNLLTSLRARAFRHGNVVFGTMNLQTLTSDPNVNFKTESRLNAKSSMLTFQRKLPDRCCLLSDGLIRKELTGTVFDGQLDPNLILNFINEICGTFKTMDGDEDERGKRRKWILENLYSVESRGPTMKTILDNCGENGNLKEFFYSGICKDRRIDMKLAKCETIDGLGLTKRSFFENYVAKSKPVILKNVLKSNWPNWRIWTNDFLRERFGDQIVHIKLTPGGEFEGVENASMWAKCDRENHFDFKSDFCTAPLADVPERVKKHLKFSKHLVMVRPASADMKMETFLDLIENKTRWMGSNGSISAYLEYTPVRENFAEFVKELPELPFASDLLQLDFLNMWLSNGNTLGKLHFDQYDNLLCQVSGKKRVIIFEPHKNQELYEGHIVEAELGFEKGRFIRQGLMDSTALTMSSVDMENPDLQIFPEFANAVPLNCTIEPGDVLFMPSFWWHEVQSYPDHFTHRNLAFNFWYQPFLQKEFPCFQCKLDINPMYRHFLQSFD